MEIFFRLFKEKRRFFIRDESILHFTEFLPELLLSIEVKVEIGENYYRARLGSGERKKTFPKEEMGAPPPEKTLKGGRANPPGISFLYLTNNLETAIAEVRPWKGATVTVATFIVKKELQLVDLTGDFYIDDPFAYGEDLQIIVADKQILRKLGTDLSKPVNPYKESIDYVPTQFVTEIIRDMDYEGMIYPSALGKGKNIVLFDENVVESKELRLYYVDGINFEMSEYDPYIDYEY